MWPRPRAPLPPTPAPILDVAQALDNPFVHERGGVQELRHQSGQAFRMLAAPVRLPGEELPARPAPALGADTDALLRELGYDAAQVAGLRSRRVV